MIKIVPDNTKKVSKPYYLLIYEYMIGDANGNTTEKENVSIDNPFLERYIKLLNSLKPVKGTWGIMLDRSRLRKHKNEKQITEDDYQFLCRMMFEEGESDFNVSPEDEEYSYEFWEGVRSDTEYSFLVFQGVELLYVDEYGKKHKTVIV